MTHFYPPLYHGTPHGEQVKAEGLRPKQSLAWAHCPMASDLHPYLAARKKFHENRYIFATENRLFAVVRALVIPPADEKDFRQRVIDILPMEDASVAFIVGDAEIYARALKKHQPTCVTLLHPENFTPVFGSFDFEGSGTAEEWVSETPAGPADLALERLRLEDMAGRIDFFELTPEKIKALEKNAPLTKILRPLDGICPELGTKNPGQGLLSYSVLDLLKNQIILPANHKFGLPPVLPKEPTALLGPTRSVETAAVPS